MTTYVKNRREVGRRPICNMLQPKHLRFLHRWQNRLGLQHCTFTLKSVNRIGSKLADVEATGKHTYTIRLTSKTLSKDWHDSVLHELLHVFMWETMYHLRRRYKKRSKQNEAMEEIIVSLFSCLVTRR